MLGKPAFIISVAHFSLMFRDGPLGSLILAFSLTWKIESHDT